MKVRKSRSAGRTLATTCGARTSSRVDRVACRSLAAICALCLLLAACGNDDPQTATDAPATDQSSASTADASASDAVGNAVDADSDGSTSSNGATGSNGATSSNDSADGSLPGDSAEPQSGLDADTLGDRGLRLPGEEPDEADAPTVEPTVAPTASASPNTSEPEPVSVEPTPTPAPTPTPPPQNDPIEPQIQLPPVPVLSDDLVIPGPPTDDGSEIEVISDSGILACSTTEAAIEFLDVGDLTRTQETLQSASSHAASSSESGIAGLASQLSNTGNDSDASFNAIVAMLSACAQYGYEV